MNRRILLQGRFDDFTLLPKVFCNMGETGFVPFGIESGPLRLNNSILDFFYEGFVFTICRFCEDVPISFLARGTKLFTNQPTFDTCCVEGQTDT